jgi:hypothetical protein
LTIGHYPDSVDHFADECRQHQSAEVIAGSNRTDHYRIGGLCRACDQDPQIQNSLDGTASALTESTLWTMPGGLDERLSVIRELSALASAAPLTTAESNSLGLRDHPATKSAQQASLAAKKPGGASVRQRQVPMELHCSASLRRWNCLVKKCSDHDRLHLEVAAQQRLSQGGTQAAAT